MKCVAGCAGPGGPGTHRPPRGGSAAYVYPAVVASSEFSASGPLYRLAESLPAVAQRGGGVAGTGEDRVMGQVLRSPAAGHGVGPAQEVDVAQAAWHRSYVPVQPGDGGHRDRAGSGISKSAAHSPKKTGSVSAALVLPVNAPGRREWLPEELSIGQVFPGAGQGEVLDRVHQLEQRVGSFPGHEATSYSAPLGRGLSAASGGSGLGAEPYRSLRIGNVARHGTRLTARRCALTGGITTCITIRCLSGPSWMRQRCAGIGSLSPRVNIRPEPFTSRSMRPTVPT